MYNSTNQDNFAAHNDQRVAVFIDSQNLYHSAKGKHRSNVNYEELITAAVGERKLVRAFAYVIKAEETAESKFFEALEQIGIEIRVKDIQVFHTGAKKADWDVGIAVDMIRLTEKVDVVVLASGDGDFLEVIRYCQSRGVRVEIMAFGETASSKLIDEADLFINLSDDNFLINKRRRKNNSNFRPAPSPVSSPAPLKNPAIITPKPRNIKPVVGAPVKRSFGHHLNDDDYGLDNAFGNRRK